MAQGSISILQGESRLLTLMYPQAAVGTVAATDPTFTLWDDTAAIVSGFDHVAAICDPPAAIIKVQYLLDTTGLAPGVYYGFIEAQLTTSADGATQHRAEDCYIYIHRVPDLP